MPSRNWTSRRPRTAAVALRSAPVRFIAHTVALGRARRPDSGVSGRLREAVGAARQVAGGRDPRRARLAGLVDWEAIVDRTRNIRALPHWSDPAAIVQAAPARLQ